MKSVKKKRKINMSISKLQNLNIYSTQMNEKEDQKAEKVTYQYKVRDKTEIQHFRKNCIATKIQTQ